MPAYLRTAGRVLIILASALVVGLSLFAFMQAVVHPLMGAPRRPQFAQGGGGPFVQGEREGPGRAGEGEGGPPRRLRPRMFLGIFSRLALFGIITAFVVIVQRMFFSKPRDPAVP